MNLPREAVAILNSLLFGIREVLGDNLIGCYLRGSLTTGDFDPDTSDLDFFAVTERPVSEAEFHALAVLHERLARLPNKYGHELEGPYIDRSAARHFRPGERHPTIERGTALEWREHRDNWGLERWMVHEHGVALFGPDPKTLIDPISPDELRAAVRTRLKDWADWAADPDDPNWLLPRGHKAYVVQTMCRALYTLTHGELLSKPQAVAWALERLPEPWRSTVERSQAWRTDSTPDPGTVPEVRRFVEWVASGGGNVGET
jgi:predicted nucleotidyltransferase